MRISIRTVLFGSGLALLLPSLFLASCRSESPSEPDNEESSWTVTLTVAEATGANLTVVTDTCGCSNSSWTFDVHVDGVLKREMDCSEDAVLPLSQGNHRIEIRSLAGAGSVTYSLSPGWHLRAGCSS